MKFATVLILVTMSTATATGGVIATPAVTSVGGIFTYDYTVSNSGSDGIFLFTLDIPGLVLSTTAPTGWLVSTTPVLGDILVQWGSGDPSTDVLPSDSLSGFVLTSQLPPGTVQFGAVDESLNEFDGQTTGPVAPANSTPEPAMFVPLGVALAGLFADQCRRRKTTRFDHSKQLTVSTETGPYSRCWGAQRSKGFESLEALGFKKNGTRAPECR